MKKIICMLLCAAFVLALAGCKTEDINPEETQAETSILTYDGKGEYAGFASVPEEYTPEAAAEDGCLVVVVSGEENGEAQVSGADVWYTFLSKSQLEEEAFMRVVYFIDGKASFEDLYFSDGRYSVFAKNDNGIYKKSDFTMIKLLEKEDGTDAFYVLTDSDKLTYEDVIPLLADRDAQSAIDFDFLPFTFYIVG